MSAIDLILLLAGAIVAAFVSGLSGFAFGLVSLSFWIWRFPLAELAAMVVFGSLVAQATAMPGALRHVQLDLLLPFIAGAVFGLPVGVLLIAWVDLGAFRLGVGLVMVAFAMFHLLIGPRLRLRRGDGLLAEIAVGWISGILGGLAGLSGVAPAIWSVLRGWSKDQQRGLFLVFNSFCHVVAMAGLVIAGHISPAMLERFVVLLPCVVGGAWLGTLAYGRVSERQFRRIVLLLLAGSGIVLTAQNGWRLLSD
jgi:uncharacterized membrane protein YfcA